MPKFICECECHNPGYDNVYCKNECNCTLNSPHNDVCEYCNKPVLIFGNYVVLKEHIEQDHPDRPLHSHLEKHMTIRTCDGKTPTVLPFQDKIMCQLCFNKCALCKE